MSSNRKKIIALAGFLYGLVLAFYAIAWGVDGPTLTMPLAASPLNLPAAVADTSQSNLLARVLPVLIVAPILAAPFCWAALALLAACTPGARRRAILAGILAAHYLGVGLWFCLEGTDLLLRPFRILHFHGALLLGFYAAGQLLIWWALLRPRTGKPGNG
jgi:hypothetical protein